MIKGATLPEPLLLQRAHMVLAKHKGDLSLHLFSFFNGVNNKKVPYRERRKKEKSVLLAMGEAEATGKDSVSRVSASLTSLDPDVLTVFGGHAHQEALSLRCLNLMQIVTRGPENLGQEKARTSQPHKSDQNPLGTRYPIHISGAHVCVCVWGRTLCPMPLTLTICCWSEGTMCSPKTSFTTCFLLVA